MDPEDLMRELRSDLNKGGSRDRNTIPDMDSTAYVKSGDRGDLEVPMNELRTALPTATQYPPLGGFLRQEDF